MTAQYDQKLVAELLALNVTRWDAVGPRMSHQLRAASERISHLEHLLEVAAMLAEQQPYYPDTHTGMRRQWVKEQIAAKIRALVSDDQPGAASDDQ